MEKTLTSTQLDKLYDEVLYQVTLRTLHELFEADVVGALDTVAFNGYVRAIDKATGQEITACVLSVTARRDEFQAINLANVDPKACFKSVKGVGSSKLHSIILVTTSDYGPDAYEFVRGKPLSLLNGGNLLHLLEKHGHKARIDLREAKALGADKPTA